MAQQPLNTYKTVVGVVSTTNTEVYSTKTGYTSIVLYLQVASTGIGIGTVSVFHKRQSRSQSGVSTALTTIIDKGLIPPNDALAVLDGRLVLERTATKTDSLVISGISTSVPNKLEYTISILETLNQ